jgi:hypothetical protein
MVGLFYGSAVPSGAKSMDEADLVIRGSSSTEGWAGGAIRFADLSGDGTLDLVIGEPLYDNSSGNSNEGRVAFFDGAGLSTGVISTDNADGHIVTSTFKNELGASLAPVSDMDGDGDAELLVGSNGVNAAGEQGEVFLFTGGVW